jgi:hypothetical protein
MEERSRSVPEIFLRETILCKETLNSFILSINESKDNSTAVYSDVFCTNESRTSLIIQWEIDNDSKTTE